ncbi:hypothetical protein Vretifemale_5033, partial [Volvox reticuliferus]
FGLLRLELCALQGQPSPPLGLLRVHHHLQGRSSEEDEQRMLTNAGWYEKLPRYMFTWSSVREIRIRGDVPDGLAPETKGGRRNEMRRDETGGGFGAPGAPRIHSSCWWSGSSGLAVKEEGKR